MHCQADGCVAVRDGSYSNFDTSKVVEGLTPIPGLKVWYIQLTTVILMSQHVISIRDHYNIVTLG